MDYASANMAAYRITQGEASPGDLEIAADYWTRNEYVRQAEVIPAFNEADFGPFRGAFLMVSTAADTDAGQRATVGTADARVVRSHDVHVYRINAQGEREYVRTDTGGKTASARNGRKGGRKPINGQRMTPAERKRRSRAAKRQQQAVPITIADLRGQGILERMECLANE